MTPPEPVPGELPMNGAVPRHLVGKLSQVLGTLDRIPKSGFNREHNYHFVRESDCADALRRELAKVGVFIFTNIDSYSREPAYTTSTGKQMFLFRVWATYVFMDGESGEKWEVRFPGEALDFSDKGLYKAETGAMKYMLMKNFLLSSDADPETDSHGEDQKQEGRAEARKPPAKPGQASEPVIVEGKVTMAASQKSRTGKEYVDVFINRRRYSTFDKKLFPALLAATDKTIRLRAQQVERKGKKFWNITEILPPPEGPAPQQTGPLDGPWNQTPAA